MACGSCGKRKVAGAPAEATGPGTRIYFYAVGPNGESSRHRTVAQARAVARKGGSGWTVVGRREDVD